MKARAIQKYIHISSQKAKLVVDLIRNKPIKEAVSILEFTNKKAALIVLKILHQAVSNAINNHAMDGSKLYIYHIVANQAPTLKRTSPRARGSADLLKKRYSHIEIVLSDDLNERKNDLLKQKELVKKRAANNKKNNVQAIEQQQTKDANISKLDLKSKQKTVKKEEKRK